MRWTRTSNICAGCGKKLNPFWEHTFTTHEFYCYQLHPDKVPPQDEEEFRYQLAASAARRKGKSGS